MAYSYYVQIFLRKIVSYPDFVSTLKGYRQNIIMGLTILLCPRDNTFFQSRPSFNVSLSLRYTLQRYSFFLFLHCSFSSMIYIHIFFREVEDKHICKSVSSMYIIYILYIKEKHKERMWFCSNKVNHTSTSMCV